MIKSKGVTDAMIRDPECKESRFAIDRKICKHNCRHWNGQLCSRGYNNPK